MSTALESENKALKEENAQLKEQLDWFRRQIFGRRSERILPSHDDQFFLHGFENLDSAEETEEEVTPARPSRRRRKQENTKIEFPDDLPVESVTIDLPEDKKVCPETQKPLVKIGEDVSQKLAHRPGSFFIKETIRPKYAVVGDADQGVISTDLPDAIIPKCKADESLLAEILVGKFNDHLPFYRMEEMLGRQGVIIPRQYLSRWTLLCGKALTPLYNEMTKQILGSKNAYVDETPVPMLQPGKGKTATAYMWVLAGGKGGDPPYRVYKFRDNRKHEHAFEIFEGYQGVFHSDKYGAYEKLAKKKDIIWCPCWAHIRRKFEAANCGYRAFRDEVLDLIQSLFMHEREAWKADSSERLRIRKEEEVPIIDQIISTCKSKLSEGKLLPKSKIRGAIGYLLGLVPYLKNYTEHAHARLDNNVAERAVRPLTIGRKNWMFFGSKQGGDSAAVILSLVQTCRGLGINPRVYLEDVMRRIQGHSNQKLHELLPDQWVEEKRKQISESEESPNHE